MQYDPIQGQGQGYEPLKVGNLLLLKAIASAISQWELATHR